MDGGRSAYYLGCLYYGRDNREEGMKCWQEAILREEGLYQAHRCLALALLEVYGDETGARREMEKAFALERASSMGKTGSAELVSGGTEKAAAGPDARFLLELMDGGSADHHAWRR